MFTDFKKNHIINTNFLCYIGLCNATSKHWRKAFSRDNENDLVVTEHESVQPFEILPPPLAGKHAFYVSKSFQKPPSEVRPFDAGFKDQKIAALYVIPFKVTKNIKLCMF